MFPCCSFGQSEYGMLARTVAGHAGCSDVGRRASNIDLIEKLSDTLLVHEGRVIEIDAQIREHFEFGFRRRHRDTMSTHNTSTFRDCPKLRSQTIKHPGSINIHVQSVSFICLIDDSLIVLMHTSYICRPVEATMIRDNL